MRMASPQMPELPKISDVTAMLRTPETQFESMVKTATKVELPPGPSSLVLNFQKSIEAGKAPELPEVPKVLAKLPTLPPLPGAGAGGEKTDVPRIGKKEVERGITFQVC